MRRLVEAYERFLRISGDMEPELVMRMRAVWVIGFMIVASQLFNMAVMYFSYGQWIYDHITTAVAIAAVTVSVQCVRWYKNAIFYAAFYAALIIAGVMASAIPDGAGINSAVAPFIALGPVLTGFIAGRRVAIGFWAAGSIVLGLLFWVSLSNPSIIAPFDYTRETNRFFQYFFALTISTGIAVMITERIYAMMTDIRAVADRARSAEAVKSEFLATMSHELRTPLNGVIGLTDALLNSELSGHERQLTATIRRSGESLLLILNDLLDFSKIEAGKLTIEKRPSDMRDLVRFVGDAWRETAVAKGLTLTAATSGAVPDRVMVDDLRLRQILQNLMSNAVKFTDHGHVSLQLHGVLLGDGKYRLDFRVTDTGVGVPEEMAARIFDPFEQGETGTARAAGGTGLGLPICRKLATLLGGTISLERSSSNGATFLLSLPAEIVVSGPGADDDVYDAAVDLTGVKVLVAEDNEVNRLVVQEFLKSWGVDAAFAGDGPTCVSMMRAAPYDLVLMDKHMPRMNGMETTLAIRNLTGPAAQTPIIAVTADAMPGEREAMLAAGMNDFITKPLRAEALKAVILRTLRSRKAA